MYIGDIVHTYPFGPRLSASRVGGVYTGDGAAPGSSPTPYSDGSRQFSAVYVTQE